MLITLGSPAHISLLGEGDAGGYGPLDQWAAVQDQELFEAPASGALAGTGVASTALVGAALVIGAFAGTGVASTAFTDVALDIGALAGTGVASTALVGAALGIGVLSAAGIATAALDSNAYVGSTTSYGMRSARIGMGIGTSRSRRSS